MMEVGELPAGWETAELAEICAINPTIDKSAIADELTVSFVPMPAVEAESGGIDASATRPFGEVKKGYTPFREGDVLFAKITPCMENGKMAVVPALHNGLGFGSTEFHVLRTHPGISPQFVYYFVSSRAFRHVAEHNMSGAVGQRRVTTPYLSACKIPVPPTAEQHRIVAKIEELFSELDQGVASLKAAREQLKVYRQSLLKNAFEGKLTAAWRAAHADQLESAEALQHRIATERQTRHQQQLADWQAAGQQGPKPKPPKPLPPLTAEELADLPELPAGWGWVKLGELMESTVGFAFKSTEFVSSGVRLLRGDNIEPGRLRWSDARYWPLERANEFAELMLAAGEIIIAMDRPVISSGLKVARVRQTDLPSLLVQRVARIKEQLGICTDFAYAAINQNRFVNHCLGHQTGTQLPHISEAQIRSYPIPLCSLAEQKQISSELESKLSEADQLDQTLATALQQADALRQSILKKAFHGQLEKQDKNEEPASTLLERIRAARATSPAKGRQAKLVSKPLSNC